MGRCTLLRALAPPLHPRGVHPGSTKAADTDLEAEADVLRVLAQRLDVLLPAPPTMAPLTTDTSSRAAVLCRWMYSSFSTPTVGSFSLSRSTIWNRHAPEGEPNA